jgi:hypothetical protein
MALEAVVGENRPNLPLKINGENAVGGLGGDEEARPEQRRA